MSQKLAGWAATAVMIACLGVGVSGVIAACTQSQRQTIKDNVIDCVKQDQSVIVSVIVEMTTALLIGEAPDWSRIESIAIRAGREVGGCALATVVDDWVRRHVPPASQAPAASILPTPAERSSVDAMLALQRFRRDHADGASFRWGGRDL